MYIKTPKKDSNLNSCEVKAKVLSYLRYERNMRAFSEFYYGYGKDCEDIVAFNRKADEVWCIEVKVSKSDFLADFKNKSKWELIANDDADKLFFNKMFFAVPKELSGYVFDYLEENYPQIGLMVPLHSINMSVRIHRSAKLLSPKKQIDSALMSLFLDRMTSEIVLSHQKNLKINPSSL